METIKLSRDWHTLLMMLVIPIVELFLLAYSAVFTVQHIPLAVFDQSHDSRSRSIIDSFTNSIYFDVTHVASSKEEVIRAIDSARWMPG